MHCLPMPQYKDAGLIYMLYNQTEKVQVRTVVVFLILTIMVTNEAVHLLLWKKETSL